MRASGRGTTLFAPFPTRLWEGKLREPGEQASQRHEKYWSGADLVLVVMSPDGPERDRATKWRE